jgi:hypothetical protein
MALSPGSTASVDGFNHEMTGSRLGFFKASGARANWVVRVDGQLAPVRLAGLWILDLLPVVISQIDSVVIVEGPLLSDGRSATAGTIDVFTRRPPPGVSVTADYQHGDESGDPGPYRYTPRATTNVEKLGPFASGALGLGRLSGSLELAARYSSLNVTDERILSRLASTGRSFQSDVNASGGSGVVAFGTHSLIAGRGRFTGLMDLPRASDLDQGRVVSTHVGLSGAVGGARATRYAVSAVELERQPIGAVSPTPMIRELWDGLVETQLAPRVHVGLGGTVGRQIETVSRTEETARAWAGFANSRVSAQGAVAHAAGRFGASASTRVQWTGRDSALIAVTMTGLDAWDGADFEWMDGNLDGDDRLRTIEARADMTTGPLVGLIPTWYARGFRHTGRALRGPIEGLAGGVAATSKLAAPITAHFRAELNQMLGDAEPGENSTPSGFAEGSLAARVAGGFAIAVSGRYAPGTTWPGPPLGDVPSTRRVDLSVNKTMWRERIRAQLVTRNLLNADDRTHPGGAQWNLRTHLAVTIALPSGTAR